MSAPQESGDGGRSGSLLLSDDEERALSRLRDMVARLRESGATVGVSAMEEGIRAAGGRRVHSTEADGPDTFLLGGALFILRPSPAMPGKIEVNFIPFEA